MFHTDNDTVRSNHDIVADRDSSASVDVGPNIDCNAFADLNIGRKDDIYVWVNEKPRPTRFQNNFVECGAKQ